MSETLDLLLGGELPNVQKERPKKQVKIKRLSDLAGRDVIFTLRALPYGKVREIQRMETDAECHILLQGCADPDWRDPRLLSPEAGIVTPVDAMRAKLLPGEIADLSLEIERLTGYRGKTIEDVKNA